MLFTQPRQQVLSDLVYLPDLLTHYLLHFILGGVPDVA
jgi:hypothetical protein